MSEEYTCFVDFGLEHVTLLVAQIENNQLISIPFIREKKINISLNNRPQSAIEQSENFDALLILISEAEKFLHTNIFSIIFLLKNKSIKLFFSRKKMVFKKQQKITQVNKEKLATSAIKDFYDASNSDYNMLDIICNNFIMDENSLTKNPYKLTCHSLSLNATIIGIKKSFTSKISNILKEFKIHTKHYISPCIAVSELFTNCFTQNSNYLFIDIGSSSAEYCIIHNGCLVYLDNICLGGLDMTRDISQEAKIRIFIADEAKKEINNKKYRNIEDEKSKFLIRKIEDIADARLNEIANFILKTIKENKSLKNIFFKKIYIFGGVAMYKNTIDIISSVFDNAEVEIPSLEYIYNNDVIINKKIKEKDFKIENIQLFGALIFYVNNLNMYQNAKNGFLFKIPSKISCFLKDILY